MSSITSRFALTPPVPWRLIAVAAALLLALAFGLLLIASGAFKSLAPPYGLAANGALYYSQGGELYVRTTTGGPALPLVTGSTEDAAPVLSPDGTKLSFLRKASGASYELWVINTDGSDIHRLGVPAGRIGWFEWAPRGDAAAVLIDTDRTALNIVPADGGPLVRHDLQIKIEQAWFLAPNGSRLGLLGSAPDGTRGIFVVGRDGTGLHRLELDPGFQADAYYDQNRDFYFWTASWSPTGDRLLYTQLEPDATSPAGPGFRSHLATIDAAGAVLSDAILVLDATSDDESQPTWLPSGDGFVFQSTEGSRHSLWLARLHGADAPTATDLGVEASDFIGTQVSPDGKQLMVILPAVAGAAPAVELIDLTTRAITPLDVGEDVTWQRLAPRT